MTTDLTKGRPLPLIFRYSLPIIGGQLFQLFYTLADTLIVGQTLGANALAAVGATTIVTYFQLVFIQGFTNGMGIVTGQCYGSGSKDKVRHSIAASNLIGLYASVILTLLFVAASFFVPSWMRIPDEIAHDAWVYMFVIFIGTATTIYYNIISNIMRALGDSKTPLYFLILSSLLNIVLDIVFILPFGWGVAGAAIATVFSQGVSAVGSYIYAKTHFEEMKSMTRQDYIDCRQDLGRHLRMALPMGLQMSVMSIGQLVMQTAVNTFGTDIIAGYTAVAKVDQMAVLVNQAFCSAVAGYVSQNYGAGDYKRIKDGTHATLFLAEAANTLMGILMFIMIPFIPYIFLSSVNAEIQDAVRVYVYAIVPFYYLLGFVCIYRTALQAMGNNAIPLGACAIELVCRCTASIVFIRFLGYFGVCFATSFAWIGASALLVPSYYIFLTRYVKPRLLSGKAEFYKG